MERTNAAFLVVVVLSTLLGAAAVVEPASELRTAETVTTVCDRIATDAANGSIETGSMRVTAGLLAWLPSLPVDFALWRAGLQLWTSWVGVGAAVLSSFFVVDLLATFR